MSSRNKDESNKPVEASKRVKPRMDLEEKSLRGFKRLTSHPRLKSFFASAEVADSAAENSAKRKKK